MARKVEKEIVSEVKEKVIADLNKEIKKSIIDQVLEFKEELKSEISSDIEKEVENVMKREEKRILRGKKFLVLKKNIIIIILFIIVCYFAYCLYDAKYFDFMKSDCEDTNSCVVNNENAKEEVEIVKDKDWYIENYGYLLDNANVTLNEDQASSYYLYSKNFKVSDIKTSYLLNMAYKKLDKKLIKSNSVNIIVKAEDLKNSYQELFGITENYSATSFTYDCLNFIYDEEKEKYIAENNECASSTKEILEEITDMYEENDKLYIETVATIYDKNEDSYYTFDNLFEPIIENVNENDINENVKKLNQYQYIYKKNVDKYYLDSITKLK